MSKRWIKVPGPGQFRGDGRWMELAKWWGDEDDWLFCQRSGYLPTHEGDAPPEEPDEGKAPSA